MTTFICSAYAWEYLIPWGVVQPSEMEYVSLVHLFALQKEAEALVKLLQEFPMAKAWVSFSCMVSG